MEPRRPSGKRVGGVEIPPPPARGNSERRHTPSSLPPEERESILGWLKVIHQGQGELADQVERVEVHAGELEQRLRAVEDAQRETSFARLELKTIDAKLDAVLASDARQNAEILTLRQQKQTEAIAKVEANKVEGKSKTRDVLVLIFGALIAAIIEVVKRAIAN
jgi:hypothetical protein